MHNIHVHCTEFHLKFAFWTILMPSKKLLLNIELIPWYRKKQNKKKEFVNYFFVCPFVPASYLNSKDFSLMTQKIHK